MTNPTTTSPTTQVLSLEAAWQDVDSSFERFCLTADIGAEQMLREDVQRLAGRRNSRADRIGHRWVRRRGSSASMAARLWYAGRGCAARVTRLRYRPGGRRRLRIGLGAGR